MCRGPVSRCSKKTVPSPNEAAASRCAPAIASCRSLAECTARIPFPPPPADALTKSGNPTSAAASSHRTESVPTVADGRVGTPAARANSLASTLVPMARIFAAVGPIHTKPASTTDWAKAAFSDKKP